MDLPSELSSAPAEELLAWAIQTHRTRFAIVTSFQHEGMVLVDLALKISPDVRVITIDTGRLPAETFDMMEQIRERYGIQIETLFPDAGEVERMVTRFGPNLFYESVAHRNLCCHVRKVLPLSRKLQSLDAYAVGLRRDQAETRQATARIAEVDGKLKLAPLADWTAAMVADYGRKHDVLRHPLYERGYQSIGCGPCTRAVQAGELERAGRWWWEADGAKECGLHFTPEGRVERTLDVLLRDITGAAAQGVRS
jgi:phosphoadenylyl-sulfate reductase (thioredoxin)